MRDRENVTSGSEHRAKARMIDTVEGVSELRRHVSNRTGRNEFLVFAVKIERGNTSDSAAGSNGFESVVPGRRQETSGFGSLRERLSQSKNSTQGVRARDVLRAITSIVHIAAVSENLRSGMPRVVTSASQMLRIQ